LSDQTIILLGMFILHRPTAHHYSFRSLIIPKSRRDKKKRGCRYHKAIPIIFGSDLGTAKQLLVIAIFLLVALIVF